MIYDVTGKCVVFDRGTTIVIARKEFLGMSINDCPKAEPIPEFVSINFQLFPNPSATGKVSLSSELFQLGKLVDIAVFDPIGTICHTAIAVGDGKQVYLDFQAKAKGTYIIRVRLDGKIGVASLIVE